MEIKQIPNTPFYAREDGIILRKTPEGFVKKYAHKSNKGYMVEISGQPKRTKRSVSRLIAEAFMPDGVGYVCHKDGDKFNNRVDNLEWTDQRGKTSLNIEQLILSDIELKSGKIRERREKELQFVREALSRGLRSVPNHPRIFASEEGVLYRASSEGLSPKVSFDCRGYRKVAIGSHRYLLHRLIAAAFLGIPPDGKPLVCHKDGDRANNHISNLYYGDYKDNALDAMHHGTKAKKLTPLEVSEIRAISHIIGARRLSKLYGVGRATIRAILSGKTWFHLDEEE